MKNKIQTIDIKQITNLIGKFDLNNHKESLVSENDKYYIFTTLLEYQPKWEDNFMISIWDKNGKKPWNYDLLTHLRINTKGWWCWIRYYWKDKKKYSNFDELVDYCKSFFKNKYWNSIEIQETNWDEM